MSIESTGKILGRGDVFWFDGIIFAENIPDTPADSGKLVAG
jgi:hypothetical protein